LEYFKKDAENFKNVIIVGKQEVNRIFTTFYISPDDLEIDSMQMDAYGIDPEKFIAVTITWFMKPGAESKLPKIESFQFGSIEEKVTDHTKEKKKKNLCFILQYQIK